MADNNKRPRDDPSESDIHSPGFKRVKTEFVGTPVDSDPDPAGQGVDSIVKSLEDEITSCPASNSGGSRPELGYLFEASDDELGLPPPPPGAACAEEKSVGEESLAELVRLSSDSSGVGEFWEFEDVIPSYDSFDLSVGEGYSVDYVPLDGLFEYSDVCSDPPFLR